MKNFWLVGTLRRLRLLLTLAASRASYWTAGTFLRRRNAPYYQINTIIDPEWLPAGCE